MFDDEQVNAEQPGAGESDDQGAGFAIGDLLKSPELWLQIKPVLDEVIDGRIDQKLQATEANIVGQVKTLLEQVTPNIPELVNKAVDEKLDALRDHLAPLLQAAGSAAGNGNGNGNGSAAHQPSRMAELAQLAPFLQSLLQQPKAGAPVDQTANMISYAKAMGEGMSQMAAPLFNAFSAGQQHTIQELTTLARFGVNPFDAGKGESAPTSTPPQTH